MAENKERTVEDLTADVKDLQENIKKQIQGFMDRNPDYIPQTTITMQFATATLKCGAKSQYLKTDVEVTLSLK